jgi:hypothetical protein
MVHCEGELTKVAFEIGVAPVSVGLTARERSINEPSAHFLEGCRVLNKTDGSLDPCI